MTNVTTQPEAVINQIELNNGVVVNVRRMADHDLLRAASIFDPTKAESLSDDIDSATARDLMDMWRGNERYLMFIVESACELVSPLPADDTWLRRFKRWSELYQIEEEDLVYLEYREAVYIRRMGMMSDEMIAAVTNIAMGNTKDVDDDKPVDRRARRSQMGRLKGEG